MNFKISKDFLILLTIAVLITLAWVGLSIFTTYERTELPAEIQTIATPFNLTLNESVLDKIKR